MSFPPVSFSSNNQHSKSKLTILRKDLERITRLAANMVEAHTSVIFLPSRWLGVIDSSYVEGRSEVIVPYAVHTLAPQQIELKEVAADQGLTGWVAKNKKAIHVSPFERDSRILGIYNADLQLKSCLGVPILPSHAALQLADCPAGVLLVDSKKAFAFSKVQGKLLEDLGGEVSALIRLYVSEDKTPDASNQNWNQFLNRSKEFARQAGVESIAALRVRTTNFSEIERQLGLAVASKNLEQLYRLVGQALPIQYPTFITPTGELLAIIDSVMTDVYTNKILAISEHSSLRKDPQTGLTVEFRARSFARSQFSKSQTSLEALINLTSFYEPSTKAASTEQHRSEEFEEPRRRIFQFR